MHQGKRSKQIELLARLPFLALQRHLNHIVRSYMNKNIISHISAYPVNIEVQFSPLDIAYYSQDLCDYNRGFCTAIMHLRLGERALHFKELSCVCKGDLSCTYVMPVMFGAVDKDKSLVDIAVEEINKAFKEI